MDNKNGRVCALFTFPKDKNAFNFRVSFASLTANPIICSLSGRSRHMSPRFCNKKSKVHAKDSKGCRRISLTRRFADTGPFVVETFVGETSEFRP